MRFYKNLKPLFLTSILICSAILAAKGQPRLSTHNSIGWYNIFGHLNLSKRFAFLPEFQWRRDHTIKDWQQMLVRVGLQYGFPKGGNITLLYAYVITYPIGDYPFGPYPFPEHRITEQFGFSGNTGIFNFAHRLRIEQRWLGQINQKGETGNVEKWSYMNRIRYQLRTDVALSRKKIEDKTWYAAAFDEVFIGFGKNVNQNVFDQNRLGLLLGYKFNKNFRLEGGYFNQIVQQPAPVNNKAVYQYNQGPIVNLFVTK